MSNELLQYLPPVNNQYFLHSLIRWHGLWQCIIQTLWFIFRKVSEKNNVTALQNILNVAICFIHCKLQTFNTYITNSTSGLTVSNVSNGWDVATLTSVVEDWALSCPSTDGAESGLGGLLLYSFVCVVFLLVQLPNCGHLIKWNLLIICET